MPNGIAPKTNFVVFQDGDLPMGEVWRRLRAAEPEEAAYAVMPLDGGQFAIVPVGELKRRMLNLTLSFFKKRYSTTTFQQVVQVAADDPDKEQKVQAEWAQHPGALVAEVDAGGNVVGVYEEAGLGPARIAGEDPIPGPPRTLFCPPDNAQFPLSQCRYDWHNGCYRCPNGHRLVVSA